MKFCGECATKLVDGVCSTCTAKSTNGLSMESLEKSLETLESLSKGVRPAEAKGGEEQGNTSAKEHNKKAVDQAHKYGKKGEGDSDEQPKTKRGVESAVKGFVPEEEEEVDPREEEERELEEEMAERGGKPEFKSAGKKAKKSFADEAQEYEGVRKAVDVSPFLEGITAQIGETIDSLREDVAKSNSFASYQRNFNMGLAGALNELANIVKGLTTIVEEIGKNPATVRKSDSSAAAIEKSFANGNAGGEQKLTKSQIANKLSQLMAAGDTTITELDVLRADSTGSFRPELAEKLGIEKQ